MIRTAFLGTPREALPALEALASLTDLRIVVTRPDRPRGRGRAPSMPPVKHRALELGLEVCQPATSQQLDTAIASSALDVVVVAAYGVLVPPRTLTRPRAGMVNLHFSLLPRWRGAAPVERAILAGDPTTGVTLMQMAEGLDTGGVLSAWETAIGSDETAGELSHRLAAGAAELLGQLLLPAVAGQMFPVPQDEARVTWAPRLSRGEARLDFRRPAEEVARAVRAFSPRPVLSPPGGRSGSRSFVRRWFPGTWNRAGSTPPARAYRWARVAGVSNSCRCNQPIPDRWGPMIGCGA